MKGNVIISCQATDYYIPFHGLIYVSGTAMCSVQMVKHPKHFTNTHSRTKVMIKILGVAEDQKEYC